MPFEHSPQRRVENQDEQSFTNRRVVSLIKEKLLPLNRGRYEHLQKINRVYRKNAYKYISESMTNMTIPVQQEQQLKKKGLTTRHHREDQESQTDVLLKRLKRLNIGGKKSSINQRSMPSVVIPSTSELFPVESIEDDIKTTWKLQNKEGNLGHNRGKKSLFDLVVKAESHLRLKKRQLKDKFTTDRSEGGGKQGRTILQVVIGSLGGGKGKGSLDEQMEKEILKDIRLGMLEAKMNRMKLDINHKKIVQLR